MLIQYCAGKSPKYLKKAPTGDARLLLCHKYLCLVHVVVATVNSLLFAYIVRKNIIFANIHKFDPLQIQHSRETFDYSV